MMRRGRTNVFDPKVWVEDRVKSGQDTHPQLYGCRAHPAPEQQLVSLRITTGAPAPLKKISEAIAFALGGA